MSADFNAGSIEGTLDLDLSPFNAGLRKAKAEADDFSHRKVSAKAGLDSGEFDAKKGVVNRDLDKIDREKVTAKADLDISEAVAKAAILNRTLSKALDAGGLGKSATGGLFSVGRLIGMGGGILSLAAALGPATAAVVAFGAAAGVAFGGAALSLGLFAKVVSSDMTKIQKAVKAGQQLGGAAGVAETAFKHLTAAWNEFQRAAGGVGYKVLTTAFNGISGILPKLVPLLHTVGLGVNGVLKQVLSLAHSGLFSQFLASLQNFMHGFLAGAGPVIKNLLSAFMHGFITLRPLMAQLGTGIEKAAAAAEHFASGSGLKDFLSYVGKYAPVLGSILSHIVSGLEHLFSGLAPLAGPALHAIDALVKAIGSINLAPAARGFGAILNAARPLLPVVAQLLNVLLRPLGALLGTLATTAVVPLAHSLKSELQPAFHALSGILSALAKPIGAFISSIANLANPTGVSLVAKLLKALEVPIKTLAPAVGKLVVALENVIDKGIQAILPLIPKLTPLLKGAANGAVLLANGLAKILSYKGVALTLLGIYGAIKAYKTVASVTAPLREFVGVMRTLMEIAKADGVIGAIGAVFPKLAAGLAAVKDMAIGTRIQLAALWVQERLVAVWGRVVAAAEKAWTAIQAALDVVLDANPIGIVVVALGALAAGLIYAYKHSQTFRNIVNAAFHAVATAARAVFGWLKTAVMDVVDFIRAHWQLLLGIFMGPLGIIVGFVITHFSQIRDFIQSALSAAVNFVRSAVSNVVGFFQSLPGRIGNFAGDMMNAGEHLMTSIWHGLENVWNNIWGWVSGLPGKIVSIFSNIGGNISGAIHNAISGAVNSLPGPLASLAHHIGLASGGVTTGITHAIIGDNPGGREAVIPLDKYDLPSKGQTAALAAAAAYGSRQEIASLKAVVQQQTQVLKDALGKIAEKTGQPLDFTDNSLRRLQQATRAM